MKKTKKQDDVHKKEEQFTKEQIVNSRIFIDNRDLLNAILEDKSYSKKEVDEIIKDYKKGKVN